MEIFDSVQAEGQGKSLPILSFANVCIGGPPTESLQKLYLCDHQPTSIANMICERQRNFGISLSTFLCQISLPK